MPATVGLEPLRQMLRTQLLRYLATLPTQLRQDTLVALSVEGKLLHQPCEALDGRWALVPFLLASELSTTIYKECVCSAALAVECVLCATDLLDDVMDEDITPTLVQLGSPRALTVALALLALAQRMLLMPGEQDAPAGLSTRLLDALQDALMRASTGQQADLLAEERSACTLNREECLEIASMKAGSLLSLACRMGALCADVDEAQIKQCAEMGRLLGIAAQLDNDAHDLAALLQPSPSQKSDLRRGKKTLPVVLAAHALCELPGQSALTAESMIQQFASLSQDERGETIAALREGILATWGISLLYRERARACLNMLSTDRTFSSNFYHVLGLDEPGAQECSLFAQ